MPPTESPAKPRPDERVLIDDQMRRTVRLVGELREEDIPPELEDHLVQAFRDWQSGPG